MIKRRFTSDFKLPDYLSENQKLDIVEAVKKNTPIIIKGVQGPTGKTTLKNILLEQDVVVFEEYECCVVELNGFI